MLVVHDHCWPVGVCFDPWEAPVVVAASLGLASHPGLVDCQQIDTDGGLQKFVFRPLVFRFCHC